MFQHSKWKQPKLSGSLFNRESGSPYRRLFSYSNSSTISKISEVSNKKGTPFWCRNSSPRVYLHCERSQTHSSGQESQNSSNIDDWLLWSPTKEQCIKDSENLVKLVQELRWLINFQKSELVPTQKLDFLGYHFDL